MLLLICFLFSGYLDESNPKSNGNVCGEQRLRNKPHTSGWNRCDVNLMRPEVKKRVFFVKSSQIFFVNLWTQNA